MAIKWNDQSSHAGMVEYGGAVLEFPVWHSNIGECVERRAMWANVRFRRECLKKLGAKDV